MPQLPVAEAAGTELLRLVSSRLKSREPTSKALKEEGAMRRVIIESPYRSGTPVSIPAVVARNVRYARACMRAALLRGDTPYASHLLYTQEGVLDDTISSERALGMEAGWAWIQGVDAVLVHTDLGISSGMLGGVARAESHRVPMEYMALGDVWARCMAGSYDSGRGMACAPPFDKPHAAHLYACPLWRAP